MHLIYIFLCQISNKRADVVFLSLVVPGPPQSLAVTEVSSDSASLIWQRPARVPGLLQGYSVEIQRLARNCEIKKEIKEESCVESEVVEWVDGETNGVTLSSLLKYREYRTRVLAFTRAGPGEPSEWIHTQTLAGSMFTCARIH